jgi:hypothetical protein
MLMSPAVFSERGGISSDFLEEPLPISLSDVARNATRTCWLHVSRVLRPGPKHKSVYLSLWAVMCVCEATATFWIRIYFYSLIIPHKT